GNNGFSRALRARSKPWGLGSHSPPYSLDRSVDVAVRIVPVRRDPDSRAAPGHDDSSVGEAFDQPSVRLRLPGRDRHDRRSIVLVEARPDNEPGALDSSEESIEGPNGAAIHLVDSDLEQELDRSVEGHERRVRLAAGLESAGAGGPGEPGPVV